MASAEKGLWLNAEFSEALEFTKRAEVRNVLVVNFVAA